MTEQIVECCICMDDIIGSKNKTITDCGHTFHCSCLMKNTAHNGYGCPYCRTVMAEVPENEDDDYGDDDYGDDDYEEEIFDDNVLTSFRMFHQRNSGDDIEEEPEPEDDEAEEEERMEKPTPEYISEILVRQGVTMEDVIKCLLVDHEEYDDCSTIERKSDEMFGRMRIIISNYIRENN